MLFVEIHAIMCLMGNLHFFKEDNDMNKTMRRLTAAITGLVTVFAGAGFPTAKAPTASAAGNLLAFPGAVGGGK